MSKTKPTHKGSFVFGLLLGIGVSLGCSRDRPQLVTTVSAKGASEATQITIPEESPLKIAPDVGSQLRFVDGTALSKMYARIFPKSTYGYQQCAGAQLANVAYREDCTDTIFRSDERPFIGIVDLHSFQRGTPNIRRPEDLTLNYTRTLRVALERECTNLIKVEDAALTAGNGATNILLKAERPTVEVLDEFFRKIIGVEGSGMAVNIGSDAYLAAFDVYVAKDKSKANRNNAYFGLCLSIAMDPQVILY